MGESKSFKQGELPASLFMQLIPRPEAGMGKSLTTKDYLTTSYVWREFQFQNDTQRSAVPTMSATANGLQVLAAWFQSENPDSKSVQMTVIKALVELYTEQKKLHTEETSNRRIETSRKLLEKNKVQSLEAQIAEMNARPPKVVIQRVKEPTNCLLVMTIVILVILLTGSMQS